MRVLAIVRGPRAPCSALPRPRGLALLALAAGPTLPCRGARDGGRAPRHDHHSGEAEAARARLRSPIDGPDSHAASAASPQLCALAALTLACARPRPSRRRNWAAPQIRAVTKEGVLGSSPPTSRRRRP